MFQLNARGQHRDVESVPYSLLWSATFLGFGAIGMTIQVMPALCA